MTEIQTAQKKPGRKLMAASDDLDDSEREAIKAIKAYEAQERKLAAFEGEHGDIFEAYDLLLSELERKRQIADTTIRALDASFGPWERFSERRSYDTQTLYQLVGEERFLELGGTVTKMPVIEIERATLELAIKKKEIPKSVVTEILTITPSYRAPKPRSRT